MLIPYTKDASNGSPLLARIIPERSLRVKTSK